MVDRTARLQDPAENPDVVFFGDSTYFCLRPSLVSDSLGADVSAVNQAWPAMGMDAWELMLESYVWGKGRPPRLIVASFTTDAITLPAESNESGRHEILRSRAFASFAAIPTLRTILAAGRYGYAWLYFRDLAMPPSMTYRAGIKRGAESILREGVWPSPSGNQARWYSEYASSGSWVLFEKREFSPAAMEEALLAFPRRPVDDPAIIAYYFRFLDRAKELGIPVFIVTTPLPEVVMDYYQEHGILAAYQARVEQILARYPNVAFSSALPPRYPNELFSDSSHLNRAGTDRYESDFRDILGRLARETGWSREQPTVPRP